METKDEIKYNDVLKEYTGFIEAYEKWNRELTDNGFVISEVDKEDFLKNKRIFYYYSGDFNILGAESTEVFSLLGELSETGLKIGYFNSRLSRFYLGYVDDENSIRNPAGIDKLKAFIKKHGEYTYDFKGTINIDLTGYITIPINEGIYLYYVREFFMKISILIEKELFRTYPFESIRDYEKRNKLILSEAKEDFMSYEPQICRYRSIRYNDSLYYHRLMKIIIRSSYSASKEEVIEKFIDMAEMLLNLKNMQKLFDEKNGKLTEAKPCAWHDEKAFYDEDEIIFLIDELKKMSDDEYDIYKNQVFDI